MQLEKVDLSNHDLSKITNSMRVFNQSNIKEVNLSNTDLSSITNLIDMFSYFRSLEELDLSNSNLS